MKYIIALIAILLIFYLHGRVAYESLDTSFGSNGKRVVERMKVDVRVGPERVAVEGFAPLAGGETDADPQRCQNWRQLRFDLPPLVPGINVNVAESEAEIGEYEGEEGFIGNFFNDKIKQFRDKFGGADKGRGSFSTEKREEKSGIETLKEEMDTALKGQPTKSVQEMFGKVVPAINPTPQFQNDNDNKALIASTKNNAFKMGLVGSEGEMGFYEECPNGWYHNNVHFTATGDGIHIKECKKSKGSKADAFATLKSGRVSAIHIRKKGKYSATPKVEIKSVDRRGKGAKAVAHLDKDGGVSRVQITDKGSGYESLPNIIFIETKKSCKLCTKPKVVLK